MSCADCRSSGGGCEAHKGPQRLLLDETMARVYPGRVWGEPDPEASLGAGVSAAAARRLARSLAVATRAPTFFRGGEPEDLCNFVWILCVGREPALLEVRDGQAELDEERVRERYLRVAVSTIARMATVQEVTLELERDEGGAFTVTETSRPGVYDALLLGRMRSMVDLLLASDVEHIDFGLLARPVEQAQTARYRERYGLEPQLVNFLFFAAPVELASVTAWTAATGARP